MSRQWLTRIWELSYVPLFACTGLLHLGSIQPHGKFTAHILQGSINFKLICPLDTSTWNVSTLKVFFYGGPPGSKNFACSLQMTAVPAFWSEPVPPNWVLSPKILPHFSLNFDYFLAQNCIRKCSFMLKTPKFALILQGGGISGLSGQLFQVPPHLIPSPTWVPPPHLTPSPTGTKNRPRKQVPHQKFC